MGAQPFIGRTYREADSNVGRVVVFRHDISDTVFGRDPEVVGQTVRLNDEPYVVVGVMPPEFTAVGAGLWTPSEGRVPAPPVEVKGDIASNRRLSYLRLIGRLRPSVSLSGAQADADRIGEHLKDALASRGENFGLLVEPLHETLVGAARRPLWMLFGASALLLMITCVNVAGILIGRGVQRRRELAIRTALGAGRARLSAQLLFENLLLSFLGLLVGLLSGWVALGVLRSDFAVAVPRLANVQLDARAVVFSIVAAMVCTVVFGWAPVSSATKLDLVAGLRSGSDRSTGLPRARFRRAILVMVEVALAAVLISGAGHAGASLAALTRVVEVGGFRAEGISTIGVPLPRSRYGDGTSQARFYRELLEVLQQNPATASASLGFVRPFKGAPARAGYLPEGREEDPVRGRPGANLVFASPGYLGTLGIPLLRGRDFRWNDTAQTEPVVLVSESLARKEWPDRDPLGMRMKVGRREALFRIAGIVGDVRSESPDIPAKPTVYLSSQQAPMPFLSLAIRTSTPEQVVPVVRQIVHGLDPDLPLGQISTLEEALANTTSSPRLRAYLGGAFSGVALLLAAMGLYAVVSTAVLEREKEMGVRMALGASPRAVLRLLVTEGAVVGACGAALGTVASVLTARFTSSLLFGVAQNDARVLAATTLVLLAVTLFASYAPTRRASRLDPVTVLKSD